MKIKRKNGFTVVELVIIIAVIAILAAVLIPTFSSIVKKASESTDIQTVRNLNTAIKIDAVHHNSMHDALAAAKANGFAVEQVRSIGSGGDNFVAWDSVNDRFVIIKKGDDGNDKFIFPSPEGEQTGDVKDTDKVAYFVFYDNVPEEQTYSIYLDGNNKTLPVVVSVGFDVGENYGIESVTYTGTDPDRNIILRTNNTGTNLTVSDTTNSTIAHFGDSGNQTINSGNNSYHEFGGALKATITGGHYVAEGGSIVVVIYASASKGNVLVDLESGSVQGTVKNTNTNTENTVTINGKPGAKTISFFADTSKILTASFESQPTYTNVVDGKAGEAEITGVGNETRYAETATHDHNFITVPGSTIKICSICGAYEYTEITANNDSAQEETAYVENTYTVINNGDGTTETVKSHDHNWGDPKEWTWEGYTKATAVFICQDKDCDQKETVIVPDNGGNIMPSVTKAATCTEPGERTYTAHLTHHGEEFTNVSPTKGVVDALEHDYQFDSFVWNDDYSTAKAKYVCKNDNSHVELRDATVTSSRSGNEITYTATYGDHTDTKTKTLYATFTTVFPNVYKYLYRVGNGNAVKLGSLFKTTEKSADVNDSSKVAIAVEKEFGNVELNTYTKDASDWTQSTLKFSGTGPVKVTIKDGEGEGYTLNLEVVDAVNATTATSATSNNVVLLNDVDGGLSVSGGKTLYGNGFTVRDTRNQPSGTAGFVNISNGGTVDNVKFVGYEPTTAVAGGTTSAGYAPSVRIDSGRVNIYNSYISGGRYALYVSGGTVYLKNTWIDGGAVGNINVADCNLTMEDCVTSTSTRGGLNGLGIHVTKTTVSITLTGTFQQHNWLTYDDMPSNYKSALTAVFSDSNYAYSYGGKTYVNMGVFALIDGQNFNKTDLENIINDKTGNNYGYIEKTAFGYTGTLYTAKAVMGTPEGLSNPEDERDQYLTVPTFTFDYTNKNYIANTGDDNYCVYDSATDKVSISLKQKTISDAFEWNPMILSAVKYGNNLSYTVTMNNADYTDKNIEFLENGDYTIVYTVNDPYNFDEACVKSDSTYTLEVNIHVSIVAPEAIVYHPEFTYAGNWSNYTAKSVTIGNDTYIMPDVTATSSTIGSTTVSGQTIYYPIVTVGGKNSSGGSYSSGKIYCFAPAFSAINIKDLNKDTGATLYTYNSSTQKWPHNISATTGPGNSAYYGPAGTRDPYGAETGASYEKYAYNSSNGGLCFTSNEIERNIKANTKTVKFHYVGNDGITYYYYIQYKYNAVTYSSGGCFAPGTLITLADGTQKAIENVTADDMIIAWDFFKGEYVAMNIALLVDHGTDVYNVVNMMFSDGTTLRTIGEHGVFDYDLNKFIYVTEENCKDYVGHRFVKYVDGGSYSIVTMTDAYVTTEETNAYSITSVGTSNAFASGLLTVAPPEDFYNWIPMGEKLKYDVVQFARDIEEYGLYTYDDFADYVTYEQFIEWNGAYLKIPVEKGYFTFEYILELIETYKQWMV